MARGTKAGAGLLAAIDGLDRIATGIAVAVLLLLVLLRAAYSAFRVGGVLLLLALLAGFLVVVVLGAGDAARRRWSRSTLVAGSVFTLASIATIVVDVATS